MINQTLKPEDIVDEFEQRHRDAMLDLVLVWGSLDGAFGMLLSRVLNMPFEEGAELIGKLPNSAKLEEVRKVLKDAPGGADAARMVRKHKKFYERNSATRNRIAHSHCAGIWALDRDFVIFAVYEKVGADDLAIDAIPIQEMQRATKWGRALLSVVLKLVDVPYNGDE